ncbi:MAG: flavodoxin family protein [Thermoplasmata archaeon]
MNCIVIYYSRSGNTELVGRYIADSLGCGEKRIYDRRDRSGILGFLRGGYDAWRGKSTEIYSEEGLDTTTTDHLIIGTPVWASNPAPAIRTFLERKKEKIDEVSFFCTMGGSGAENAFQTMEKLSGKKPVATLALTEKELEEEDFKDDIKEFKNKIV